MMQQNKANIIENFRVDLRLFERAIDRINQANCCLGINIPQCHTIMEIGLAKGLTVNALADKMNLDKSTISRQVEKLVKSELVSRLASEEDRRKVIISLTPKGQEVYQTMNTSINEQFEEVFQQISKKDLVTFLKVFNHIAKAL